MTDGGFDIRAIGLRARQAAAVLRSSSGAHREAALRAVAEELEKVREELRGANTADMQDARSAGMSEPLCRRLEVSDQVFAYMQKRVRAAAALPDPVGRVLTGQTRPDGLRVEKISVPLGVIGMIYESRPNVTTDAAAVCLKSANAVILRGGSESLRTNGVLADAITQGLIRAGLPIDAVQLIRTPGHEAVAELLKLDDCIDVLIPRGGKGLIQRIAAGTRIPVIKHYEGICHLYLAADAPTPMSVELAVNSKCQRVEVCNALETLLVDEASAARLLPELVAAFTAEGVVLRGCERTLAYCPALNLADADDWSSEYLAPILSIRVVSGIDAAIEHIQTYGSGHTDGIVTRDVDLAQRFIDRVDSASVLVNASTRLSGGGDYGLGAVVGISTDKLHARGPVGPDELTSYKWVARGQGHLRR